MLRPICDLVETAETEMKLRLNSSCLERLFDQMRTPLFRCNDRDLSRYVEQEEATRPREQEEKAQKVIVTLSSCSMHLVLARQSDAIRAAKTPGEEGGPRETLPGSDWSINCFLVASYLPFLLKS